MNRDVPKLNYFISEKSRIVVVSFVGPLVRDSALVLQECQAQILERNPSLVILYFRDVPDRVDQTVFPAIARIQKAIRDKNIQLKLCSLHPHLRTTFNDFGIIRPNELADNLAQALEGVAALRAA